MGILDPEDFKKYSGKLPKMLPDGVKCNGRLRQSRGYCRRRPEVGGNGRCKLHGARSHWSPNNLGYELTMHPTRSNYLPPELKARFESLTGDAIDGLEETIKIQQAFEVTLIEKLQTGESAAAWKVLGELVQEYEYGDDQTRPKTFNRIKQVAQGGLKAYGVQKEILDLHERQRKQTETLTRCRKDVSETFTQEQWNEMMSHVLRTLKLHCDGVTLRAIATDFERDKLASVINVTPTKEIENGSTGIRQAYIDAETKAGG